MGEILLVGNVRRAGVFSRQRSAEFYPLHKNAITRAFIYIFITRTAAKVSFQTLVGSTHALMSSVHELYKEPWGAALMFPFLRFLSMADITAWKYIS